MNTRTTKRRSRAAVLLLTLGLMALQGCESSYLTYPMEPGTIASSDINNHTVQTVLAVAIPASVDEQHYAGPYVPGFPPGMEKLPVFDMLAARDERANMAQPTGRVLPVYQAMQVRVRGWTAQVDILRPINPNDPGSPDQLVTVALRWRAFVGWFATAVKVWHIDPAQALRQAPYQEPFDMESAPIYRENQTNQPGWTPGPGGQFDM